MTANHDEHVCIHEEQLQNQSRKLERLETRSEFKEKEIEKLNSNMEKIDGKLDELLEGFNQFKLESNKDDTALELRLKAIETELTLQKSESTRKMAWIGIALTIITILINVYFNVR